MWLYFLRNDFLTEITSKIALFKRKSMFLLPRASPCTLCPHGRNGNRPLLTKIVQEGKRIL